MAALVGVRLVRRQIRTFHPFPVNDDLHPLGVVLLMMALLFLIYLLR